MPVGRTATRSRSVASVEQRRVRHRHLHGLQQHGGDVRCTGCPRPRIHGKPSIRTSSGSLLELYGVAPQARSAHVGRVRGRASAPSNEPW